MHYVSGHEVAQHLTAEVHQLAFSQTKAWNKRSDMTYMCQVGGMIALKLNAQFDCSPEMMLDIILLRQMEWDLHARELKILEEYDTYNQIVLLTVQIPALDKITRLCLYRCTVTNYITKQYHIVYQSIDHDKIPPDDMVITCAPSGYFISPVEGEENKCRVISVFQFPAEGEGDNQVLLSSLCSSSERIIAALQGAARRCKEHLEDSWDTAIYNARKDLYNRMHVDGVGGWSLRVHHTGLRMYTRNIIHGEFQVATRTSFTLPYPTHVVARQLYSSFQHIREWDPFVTWAEPAEYVRENAHLRRLAFSDLQDGSPVTAIVFCCLNVIEDNVCDVAYKVTIQEKLPSSVGCIHGSMPSCGFIVHTCPEGGSTVQYLMQTCYPSPLSDPILRREAARLIHHLHCMLNYSTKKLREEFGVSKTEVHREKEFPVMLFSDAPYVQIADEFSSMLLKQEENWKATSITTPSPVTILSSSLLKPPSHPPAPPPPASRAKSKRKLNASTLRNVEDVVLKNPRKPEASIGPPTKPFLFLVSDSAGTTHRFVQRRRGSPLNQSNFDLLPQELLLEIFLFLEPSSLNSISRTCTHFRELIINCQLWRALYSRMWGEVRGRVARRYCGDDDPTTFFDSSFQDWKELFLERQYIELAWEHPARRALSFNVTKGHARAVRSMALLPARHRLVTGSQDRLVRVWDVTSGACLLALQGISSVVAVQAWGDTHVKVGYKNGMVRVFDVMSEECATELQLGTQMRGCIFTTNSVITWLDNAVHWDEVTQQPIATFSGHTKRIKGCALSPTQNILYTASRDSVVRMWDLRNQTKIASIVGHTRAVNTVEKMDDYRVITGSSDETVLIWDTRKITNPIHSIINQHQGKVKCVKYTEIGKKICTAGEDGVNIWRGEDFSHVRKDADGEPVSTLAMDEESVAYGWMNGNIQFYDFAPHR